jgi:hypothetical protein
VRNIGDVQMKERMADGAERVVTVPPADLRQLVYDSADRIAARSAIVNCRNCPRRFLVNTQDFAQVRECRKGFGCKA